MDKLSGVSNLTESSIHSNSKLFLAPERKCSPFCNHTKKNANPGKVPFKTKKQLRDEEEKNNILRAKIKCILVIFV